MASHRKQKGTVLVISLLILLVMTTLGVSAMLGSNLQERMVANQKQTIQASMAAESGALMAIRWLRAHPEAWGDAKAWKADGALPSRAPSAPNLGGGVVYWIENIRFEGRYRDGRESWGSVGSRQDYRAKRGDSGLAK